MKKINLESELVTINTSEKEKVTKILSDAGVSEVKGLLGYAELEDKRIINMIGGNSINKVIHDMHGKALSLEKEEKFHGSAIFISEQIKDLCLKYKLKFLPSTNFIGNFGVEVAAKVKELQKKIGESMDIERAEREGLSVEEYRAKENYHSFKFDDFQLKNNFFIMAPPSMFDLTDRPKPEKIRQVRDYDPVLFYKTKDDTFAMVYKWGNDFGISRAIKGWIYKNEQRMLFFTSIIICSILLLSISSFTDLYFTFSKVTSVFFVVMTFLISPLLAILMLPKPGSDVYSEHGWNTPFKK